MQSANPVSNIKVVLIGAGGVGKSGLFERFAYDNFNASHMGTGGIDFTIKSIKIDGMLYRLQLWDTAGQEKYRSITKAYIRGVNGIVVVYDATMPSSFDAALAWIDEIRAIIGHSSAATVAGSNDSDPSAPSQCQRKFPVDSDPVNALPPQFCLVGNKMDLVAKAVSKSKPCVDLVVAREYATKNNMLFFTASAKTGENVNEVFMETCRHIVVSRVRLLGPPKEEGNLASRSGNGNGETTGSTGSTLARSWFKSQKRENESATARDPQHSLGNDPESQQQHASNCDRRVPSTVRLDEDARRVGGEGCSSFCQIL